MSDDRPRAWNSTLRVPKKPLSRGSGPKRRSFRDVHRDDPDMYGDLFDRVRQMPCWGIEHVPGHLCWERHTAHHIGRKDSDGMLPTCEALHAILDRRSLGLTLNEFLASLGRDFEWLRRLALDYIAAASADLSD